MKTRFANDTALRLALSSLLLNQFSVAAYAQSTVPVIPSGNDDTQMDMSRNGVPIIVIDAPDTDGVSHSIFDKFDVNPEGIIINNSSQIDNSLLAGQVLANPNLRAAGREADLVIAEVLNGGRSSLNGPLEMFGGPASFILANSSGITCDGCGFINMPQVTLSTGRVDFGPDGRFSGLNVTQGDVRVEGEGLLAGNVDFFDIVSLTTHINAQLHAGDLLVSAGAQNYNTRLREIESLRQRGAGVAIDSSLLGGMYANRIRLVGNDLGVGINLSGSVGALASDAGISADGDVHVGEVVAAGDLTIQSHAANVSIASGSYSGGDAQVQAAGDVALGGNYLGAAGDVGVQADGNVRLGGGALYAGLQADGTIGDSGDISVEAQQNINLDGAALLAGGDIAATGQNITGDADGSIGSTAVEITARDNMSFAGGITASSNLVIKGGRLVRIAAAQAEGTLDIAGQDVELTGRAVGLEGAKLNATDQASISQTAEFLTNGNAEIAARHIVNDGSILGVGAVQLASQSDIVNSGNIVSGSTMSVTAPGVISSTGELSAQSDVQFDGDDIQLGGAVASDGQISLAGRLITVSGVLSSQQGIEAHASEDILVQSDSFFGTKSGITLSATNEIVFGGMLNADGDSAFSAKNIDLAGDVTALGALDVTADNIAISGALASAGSSTLVADSLNFIDSSSIQSDSDLVIKGGTITANGAITGLSSVDLEGSSFSGAGQTQSLSDISLTFSDAIVLDSGGLIATNGGLDANAQTISNSGQVSAVGEVNFTTEEFANDGEIVGGASLVVDASDLLINSGSLAATGDIGLGSDRIDNSGSINANGDVTANADTDLVHSGSAYAGGVLNFAAPKMDISGSLAGIDGLNIASTDLTIADSASMQTAGILEMASAGSLALNGFWYGKKGVDIQSEQDLEIVGIIESGATALLSAGDAIDISGGVFATGQADLKADGIVVSGDLESAVGLLLDAQDGDIVIGGSLSSLGDSNFTASNAVQLSEAAVIQNVGTLSIFGQSITHAGDITADGAVTLNVDGDAQIIGNIGSNGVINIDVQKLNLSGILTGIAAVNTTSDSLQISADGAMLSTGAIDISAASSLSNAGEIAANGRITLETEGLFDNQGALRAHEGATIEAGAIQLGGEAGFGADTAIKSDGDISLVGDLFIDGAMSLTAANINAAEGSNFTSGADEVVFASDGSLQLDGAFGFGGTYQAIANDISVGGQLSAVDIIGLTSVDVIDVDGIIFSEQKVTLDGKTVDVTGELTGLGGIKVDGDTLNFGTASLLQSEQDIALSAMQQLSVAGDITAFGELALSSDQNLSLSGNMQSDGNIGLDAAKVNLSGVVVSDTNVVLTGGEADVAGDVSGFSGLTVTLDDALRVTKDGALLSGDQLTIKADSLTQAGLIGSDGALSVTISGDMQNSGHIESTDRITLSAVGDVSSSGDIVSSGDIDISAKALDVSGVVQSGEKTSLSAVNVDIAGSIGTGTELDVAATGKINLTEDALLTSDDLLSLDAVGDIDNQGIIYAVGNLSLLSEAALSNDGIIQSDAIASLNAISMDLEGKIFSAGALSFDANHMVVSGELRSEAAIDVAALSFSSTALSELNSDGSINIIASGALTHNGNMGAVGVISLSGDEVDLSGDILGLQTVGIAGQSGIDVSGFVESLGAQTYTSLGDLTVDGRLLSSDALQLDGEDLSFGADSQIESLKELDINANGNLASNGLLATKSTLNTIVGGSAAFLGTVFATAKVADEEAVNSDGESEIQAETVGSIVITSTGDSTITGQFITDGKITVAAANANIDGQLNSSLGVKVNAADNITTGTASEILSGGDIDFTAKDFVNRGAIDSAAALMGNFSGSLDNEGLLLAAGKVALKATGNITNSGTIASDDDVAIDSDADVTLGGLVNAAKILDVDGNNGTFSGLLYGALGLDIALDGTVSSEELSQLSSGVDLKITSGSNVSLAGEVGANAVVTIDAADRLISSGPLDSGKNIALNAKDITVSGSLFATTGLVVDAEQDIVFTGSVTSLVSIALDAGNAVLIGSAAQLHADEQFTSESIEFSNLGQISALGIVDIDATTATLGNSIASAADISVNSNQITQNGQLFSDKNITLVGDNIQLNGVSRTMGNYRATATQSLSMSAINNVSAGDFRTDEEKAADGVDLAPTGLGMVDLNAAQLTLGGRIEAVEKLDVDASTSLAGQATLISNSDVLLASSGDNQAGGIFYAEKSLIISGQTISSDAIAVGLDALTVNGGTGGVTLAGSFQTQGNGLVKSLGDIMISKASLAQSDADSQLSAVGNLTLESAGSISNAGKLFSDAVLTLIAPTAISSEGLLSGANLVFNTANFSSTGIIATDEDFALSAQDLTFGGHIISGGDISLTSTTGDLVLNGQLEADNVALLSQVGGLTLSNEAFIAAQENTSLTAILDMTINGKVSANQKVELSSSGGGVTLGTEGQLFSSGIVKVTASDNFESEGIIESGVGVDISASAIETGAIGSNGGVTLGAVGDILVNDRVDATGAVSFTSDNGSISLNTDAILISGNSDGTDPLTGNAISITARNGDITSAGLIVAGYDSDEDGNVFYGGDIALTAEEISLSDFVAGNKLSLDAEKLTISGDVVAQHSFALSGADVAGGGLATTSTGYLYSAATLDLSLNGLFNEGSIRSDGAVIIDGSAILQNAGSITALQHIALTNSELVYSPGALLTNGDITVSGISVTLGDTTSFTGGLSVQGTEGIILEGDVYAKQSATLIAQGSGSALAMLEDSSLATGENIALTSGAQTALLGQVASGGTFTAQVGGSFTNSGKLVSNHIGGGETGFSVTASSISLNHGSNEVAFVQSASNMSLIASSGSVDINGPVYVAGDFQATSSDALIDGSINIQGDADWDASDDFIISEDGFLGVDGDFDTDIVGQMRLDGVGNILGAADLDIGEEFYVGSDGYFRVGGDLAVTANEASTVAGTVIAIGNMDLDIADDLAVISEAYVGVGGDLSAAIDGSFSIGGGQISVGTTDGGGNVTVAAQEISIQSDGDKLDDDGNPIYQLFGRGKLNLISTNGLGSGINVGGAIVGLDNVDIVSAKDVTVGGSIQSLQNMTISANDVFGLSDGAFISGGPLVNITTTTGDIVVGGSVLSIDQVILDSGADITLASTGAVQAVGNSRAIVLDAASGDDANIAITTNGTISNDGLIITDGSVFADAGSLATSSTGKWSVGRELILHGDNLTSNLASSLADDRIVAGTLALYQDQAFANSGDLIFAHSLLISASSVSNSGLIAANGNLHLMATNGDITNSGTFYAGGSATLSVTNGDFENDEAVLLAQGDIAITSQNLFNRSGTIESLAGSIDITTNNLTNEIKTLTIESIGDSQTVTENSGASQIVAAGGLSINAANVVNVNSSILAGGDLTITATNLSNVGTSVKTVSTGIIGENEICHQYDENGCVEPDTEFVYGNVVKTTFLPAVIQAGGTLSITANQLGNGSFVDGGDDIDSNSTAPSIGAGGTAASPVARVSVNSGELVTGNGTGGGQGPVINSPASPGDNYITLPNDQNGTAAGAGTTETITVTTPNAEPTEQSFATQGQAVLSVQESSDSTPVLTSPGAVQSGIGKADIGNVTLDPVTASPNTFDGTISTQQHSIDGVSFSDSEVSTGDNSAPVLIQQTGPVETVAVDSNAIPQNTTIGGDVNYDGSGQQILPGDEETLVALDKLPGAAVVEAVTFGPAALAVGSISDASNLRDGFLLDFLNQFGLTQLGDGFSFGDGGSLFTFNDGLDAAFLFSSKEGLDGNSFDSSQYFDELSDGNATRYTRLGDGFFETQFVAQQVRAATNQTFLPQFGSSLDQAQSMMQAAVDQQTSLGLSMGVALTADQLASLNTSIVWYVTSEVAGREVLVPIVYLAAADQKILDDDALLAGENVVAKIAGDIQNSGAIDADQLARFDAGGDIVNQNGGSISGGLLVANAARDIFNQGSISADDAYLMAGRDILMDPVLEKSTTATNSSLNNGNGYRSESTQLASRPTVNVTNGLAMSSGRNMDMNSVEMNVGGPASLYAKENMSIGGVETTTSTTESHGTSRKYYGNSSSSSTTFNGSTFNIGGDFTAVSDGRIDIEGSKFKIGGDALLVGKEGLSMKSAEETMQSSSYEQAKRNTDQRTFSSTTNKLTTMDVGGDLTTFSEGNADFIGVEINTGGAFESSAKNTTISGVTDSSSETIDTKVVRKKFLSKKTTKTHIERDLQQVRQSTISGNTVEVISVEDTGIFGSNVVGTDKVGVTSGGNTTIGTMTENNHEYNKTSVKKAGISLGSGGFFAGVAKVKSGTTTDSITNIGSMVGSVQGDVSSISGGSFTMQGSQMVSPGDTTISADKVTITNDMDVVDSETKTQSSSFGLSIGVKTPLLSSANNAKSATEIASQSGNDRVKAVAAVGAGIAAKNVYDAGKKIANTITAGKGNLGVSLEANIGFSKSRSESQTHDETVVPSLLSGNNTTVLSNSTIDMTGSTAEAKDILHFSAPGAITISLAEENDTQSGSSKSVGASIGVSVGAELVKPKGKTKSTLDAGVTATASFNSSKSKYSGTTTTNIESNLSAGGTARVTTPDTLTLDGATLSGKRVEVDAGSLDIISRQDTSTYDSKSTSVGVSASYTFGGSASVSGNLSKGEQSGEFASVQEQAGIFAGEDGFDVRVDGETALDGAVIASEAEAAKNRLETGSLSITDIENREEYSASQVGISAGLGDIGRDGKGNADATRGDNSGGGIDTALGNLTAGLPTAFSAGGEQSGTTRSAIAGGTIIVGGEDRSDDSSINRDTDTANDGALTQEFTDDKREEIADGFAAAQILTAEVGTFLDNRAREADEAERKEKEAKCGCVIDPNTNEPIKDENDNELKLTDQEIEARWEEVEIYKNNALDWSPGSTERQILTGLVAAASGDVAGSATGLVKDFAVNMLQQNGAELIGDLSKDGKISDTQAAFLHAAVGCAGGAAGASGSCEAGAAGQGGGKLLSLALGLGDDPDASDDDKLTEEERNAQSRLLQAIVAAIGVAAGAEGSEIGAAIAGAQAEVENNQLAGQKFSGSCGRNDPTCNAISNSDYAKLAQITGFDEFGRPVDKDRKVVYVYMVNGQQVTEGNFSNRLTGYQGAYASAQEIALRELNPDYVSERDSNRSISYYGGFPSKKATPEDQIVQPTEEQIAFILTASNTNDLDEGDVKKFLQHYGGLENIDLSSGDAGTLGYQLAKAYVDGREAFNEVGLNQLAKYDDPSNTADFLKLSKEERNNLILAYQYARQSGQMPKKLAIGERVESGINAVGHGVVGVLTGIGTVGTLELCVSIIGCAVPAGLGTTTAFELDNAVTNFNQARTGYEQQTTGGYVATRVFNVDADTGELIYVVAQVGTGVVAGGGAIKTRPGFKVPDADDLVTIRARYNLSDADTVAAGYTDIPGLSGRQFEGLSPALRKEGGLQSLDDLYSADRAIKSPSPNARGQNHAEEDILNAISKQIDEANLPPSMLFGRTVNVHVSQKVCSTCAQGFKPNGVASGVVKQFSERYPALTIRVTNGKTNKVIVVKGGKIVGD